MAETAKKLNRSGGSHSGYYDMPYELRQRKIMRGGKMRKLNPTHLLVSAFVGSVSTAERASDFTYAELSRRYRLSVVTVGRAVRDLLAAKLITRDEKCAHDYRMAEAQSKERYLHFEEWIYHATFDGNYLSHNEIAVLFYLISWKKQGKDLEASNAYIARGLNLSKTTVGKCLGTLRGYKLVFVYGRSVNSHTNATYRVNGKLLREKRKEVVKRAKGKSEAVKAFDEDTARKRWYAARRSEAERRAEQMKERACADAAFRDADDAVRRLTPQIEIAEVYSPQKVADLRKARLTAERVRAERLRVLGLVEEDFLPRWSCPSCEDTGTRSDGLPCDCYNHRRDPR